MTRLAILALALLPACAAGVRGSVAWHRASSAYTMGNYPGALKHVETELERTDDPEQAATAHAFAIVTLGKQAGLGDTPAVYDAEAQRHYDDAKAAIGDDAFTLGRLEHAMGSYYASTHRLRKGLPYIRAALVAAEKSDDIATQIAANHGMARIFASMGELELRDDYHIRATRIGGETVGAEDRPAPGPELDAWLELLDWTMQDALTRPDAKQRIKVAWPKLERALSGIWRSSDKFKMNPVARETRLARRSIALMRAASAFAAIGKRNKARALYEQVMVELDMWGGSVAIGPLQNRLACTEAQIELHLGNLERAKSKADTCVGGAASARDREILEGQLLTLLGQIREQADDLDGAAELFERDIARFETIRAAIPVDERAAFFRSAGRAPWEGLVRVRTRQLLATQNDSKALDRLIEATDGMRARQLRDLAGESATEVSAAALRRTLGKDAVIVSVAHAGPEISVVVIGARTAKATILRTSPRALDVRLTDVTAAVANAKPAGAELAQLGAALFGDVARQIAGAKRIAFVADGALASFPVELLVVGGRRLGDHATVAYAPSLSFLARSTQRRHDDRLYAFGDPTYVEAPASVGYLDAAESRSLQRGSALLTAFTPLPETRSEVLAIAELFEGRADVMLGADASESMLGRKPPTAHAYVHFATHGILAGQLPGLGEPALVLANEKGSDGFLTASEVGALKLQADLAVLSACSTGAGDTLPGEGVMGMSRAFLAAGSRGVVASLWPVSSKATEALMVELYRQHRAGLDAGRALREAKRVIAKTSAWRDPYYWAAFVLVAEGGMLVDAGEIDGAGKVDPTRTGPDGDRGLVLKTDPEAPAPGAFANDYEILPPFE